MCSLLELQQQEYVMRFFMDLNDSYSHIQGQILLLKLLPPINKVFSHVLQEKRQRDIGSILTPSIQYATLSYNKTTTGNKVFTRKERPLVCTVASKVIPLKSALNFMDIPLDIVPK